jgi:hypothetical protein
MRRRADARVIVFRSLTPTCGDGPAVSFKGAERVSYDGLRNHFTTTLCTLSPVVAI